jgi:predicted  nucleic acid-binding Zn-ribbon protein
MKKCEYCETVHPDDQASNPHYCIARLSERVEKYEDALAEKEKEIERLSELLWGMRCVYCGEIIGKDKKNQDVAVEMLKAHVESCPKHPLTQANEQIAALREQITALKEKDDLLYVYQNTPFAHWHKRALKAEDQIATLLSEKSGLECQECQVADLRKDVADLNAAADRKDREIAALRAEITHINVQRIDTVTKMNQMEHDKYMEIARLREALKVIGILLDHISDNEAIIQIQRIVGKALEAHDG